MEETPDVGEEMVECLEEMCSHDPENLEEIEKSFDKENCNDFVVDQCISLPFGVFQDVTFRDCQGLCNEILDCSFFVHYAQDIGVCEIWNSTLGEFEGTCGIHMGPLQPSIQDAPQFCNVTEEPCLVSERGIL